MQCFLRVALALSLIGCGSSAATRAPDAAAPARDDTPAPPPGVGGAGGSAPKPAAVDAPTAGPGAEAGAKLDAAAAADAAKAPDAARADAAAGDALPATPGKQIARPKGTTAAAQGYLEYVPPGYGDGMPRPLLVFLHGVGENGTGSATDLQKLTAHGPPKLIAGGKWPADRPFIVLSPQEGGGGCPTTTEVDAFLTYALASYQVDTKRVYLTGLSCGAIGSWNYLGQFRGQRVVAAALIAGDGSGAWRRAMCNLGEVAIWAFHGDADPTVPVAGDIMAMNGLMACPMPPRKEALLTIYPGVGHDSWTRTYDGSAGHDIYTWLLKFSK